MSLLSGPLTILRFPRDVVSTNRLSHDWFSGRGRWRRMRDREAWLKELMPAPHNLRAHGERRHVLVRRLWHWPAQELDYENFVGGCKYLIDALVKYGWLADDNPQSCRREYVQEPSEWRALRAAVEVELWRIL